MNARELVAGQRCDECYDNPATCLVVDDTRLLSEKTRIKATCRKCFGKICELARMSSEHAVECPNCNTTHFVRKIK